MAFQIVITGLPLLFRRDNFPMICSALSHIDLKWDIVNVSLCFYHFSLTNPGMLYAVGGLILRLQSDSSKSSSKISSQYFLLLLLLLFFFFLMNLSILGTILPVSQNGFRDFFLRIMFHFEKETGVDYEKITNPIFFWHKRLIKKILGKG